MSFFEKTKKNFGFGCMRLPMLEGGNVNYNEFSEMIDAFMDAGFNYFDTAHGYLNGKSETALKDCLVKRYPRESYVFANKLSFFFFEKEDEIRPLFLSQLEACGLEYFDMYLMHAMSASRYEKYKNTHAFEIAKALKSEGKIKHIGMSFHDKADVLDMILAEQDSIEFVQIQFNYSDYEDERVESRKCYEVCRKYGKPIIVMEPVRGGSLVNLPEAADKILKDLNGGSNASYAIRYAASFEGVEMVLSGMSDKTQMLDNLSYMSSFKPLNALEHEAVNKVRKILKLQNLVPCTACKYCMEVCPKNIPIPEIFASINDRAQNKNWNIDTYNSIFKDNNARPADCLSCGKCERACPQNINIRELLNLVVKEIGK